MEATSKWHKFLGLPKWSPEIVPIGLPELWEPITPDFRVQSWRGLNQSYSPRRDLSNAMLHSQVEGREEVDSRLLMVGSQTVNLTLGPSFAHNLGCKYPNDQCKAIFDIYVSRPFQWHQEHLKARCFGPCCRALNIRESRRTPNPQLCKCWASRHTWPKWGCDIYCLCYYIYVMITLSQHCMCIVFVLLKVGDVMLQQHNCKLDIQ
jgi:hypothetical protein